MRKLLVASATSSAVFLLCRYEPSLLGEHLSTLFKIASIALLIVIAATATPRRKLLILALAFSACGDFLLDLRSLGPLGPKQLFLCGLVSFLIAHLFYVALFARNFSRANAARKLACLLIVISAVANLRVLWSGLAEMRIPVLIYSIVLTTMAIAAQLSRFSWMVAVGALSFVASDTMLAMSIFGHPFRGSWFLVWITYYVAQVLICVGVVTYDKQHHGREERAFASISA